jgi:hypothetical protein
MGVKKKEHRKKVAKRNEMIKLQEKKMQKMKEEFIMKMIQREKEAGKFNNNPSAPVVDTPVIDVEGPQI